MRTIVRHSSKKKLTRRMPARTKVVAKRRIRPPLQPRLKPRRKLRPRRRLRKMDSSTKRSKSKMSFTHMTESSLTVRVVRSR